MCIICQYQWPVSHNVTNIGWFLFLFSIEAGCFGSIGVTNFWKLKHIHWTKPKILPQSLDFGNWLYIQENPSFQDSPPKKKGGPFPLRNTCWTLEHQWFQLPRFKVIVLQTTDGQLILCCCVRSSFQSLQRKNQRLSYLQLVFWDLLSISWQQVSIYNVRVQVVALYVGCGDEYLNVWCVQQHGDQVLAQLHLKTGWRYSVPSMEQSEHLNSIQDVQKDLLCKRSTSVLYYSRTHTHMYGHVTCVLCLVSIRAEKNSYILQVWSSWDWLWALFSNSYCSSRGQLSIAFTVCTTSLSSPSNCTSVEGEVWNLHVFVYT